MEFSKIFRLQMKIYLEDSPLSLLFRNKASDVTKIGTPKGPNFKIFDSVLKNYPTRRLKKIDE